MQDGIAAFFLRKESFYMAGTQNGQNMSIRSAIEQRRSVGQMTDEVPTREQIEQLLRAATYAPNHHLTEPWHFFVLSGAIRDELGEVMADALRAQMQETSSEKAQMQLLKERNKPLRAPIIIAVSVEKVEEPNDFMERIEAASAGVQNMLLAAQELGLATLWRTGNAAYDPQVKRWLGLTPEDHIVAFVYVGFSRLPRQERVPTSFAVKTTWLS